MSDSHSNSITVTIVIAAHNEGDEVRKTISSIRESMAHASYDILLIDDGSDDGCCEEVGDDVCIIRHDQRIGIAYSRHEACQMASGDVIAILDGHQRLEDNSLQQCAELAVARSSIVCPDTSGFEDEKRLHGAYFAICRQNRYFSAEWMRLAPKVNVRQVTSLKAPAYFIPRSVYHKVQWASQLRGWGGSEACVSLKAFFAGVDILHCCGPLIRHLFKPKFHYEVGWPEVWRNQAMIARICFSDRSWYRYWLPEVFESHLSDAARVELESEAIKAEQAAFAKFKVRSDEEFWIRLLFHKIPEPLRYS